MSNKVKLLLYLLEKYCIVIESLPCVLVFMSSSPAALLETKLGSYFNKQLDLYFCEGQKIMAEVDMASVNMASVTNHYGKCNLW